MSMYENKLRSLVHRKKTQPNSKNGVRYRKMMDAVEETRERASMIGIRILDPVTLELIKRDLIKSRKGNSK